MTSRISLNSMIFVLVDGQLSIVKITKKKSLRRKYPCGNVYFITDDRLNCRKFEASLSVWTVLCSHDLNIISREIRSTGRQEASGLAMPPSLFLQVINVPSLVRSETTVRV